MRSTLFQFLAVLVGAAAHHYLFWEEDFGLNTLVFAVLTLSLVYGFHRDLSRSPSVLVLTVGTVFSALAVVFSHSDWSKIMYVLSFTLLIGVFQQRELRFLWYAFCLGAVSWLITPVSGVQAAFGAGRSTKWSALLRWFKLLFFPLVVFGMFLVVYSEANSHLMAIVERIGRSFEWLAEWDEWVGRLLFFLFGLGLLSSMLFPRTWGRFFVHAEDKWGLRLQRRRPDRHRTRYWHFSMSALRNEYWMGILVISMLNGLLLLVNLLDLRYVWWPPVDPSPQELSQFVHQGTSMLILAILMAMGVLLFFFRRNLNFLAGNRLLKRLSYLWIAQNGLLAFSVAIRNMHYIQHYGLTHNRLGVLLFLLLVGFGLLTLYAKIRFAKTVYYLLLFNAWFVYAAFLCYGMVNWNIYITRYNLQNPPATGIDEHYLEQLPLQNTFLLLQYRDRLPELRSNEQAHYSLHNREERLRSALAQGDWREWNWADERNRRYLRRLKQAE